MTLTCKITDVQAYLLSIRLNSKKTYVDANIIMLASSQMCLNGILRTYGLKLTQGTDLHVPANYRVN